MMLSRMKKYNILIRKGAENTEEGLRLKRLTLNCDMNDISNQEKIVEKLCENIKTENTKMETMG
eukprot:11305141-Heterocapsa_arctica.AAC.1